MTIHIIPAIRNGINISEIPFLSLKNDKITAINFFRNVYVTLKHKTGALEGSFYEIKNYQHFLTWPH